MEKVLVTGCNGFIGSHLVDVLMTKGYKVFGYDLKDGEDICFYKKLNDRFEIAKPDIVIHLAARTGVRNSWKEMRDYYNTNVLGTNNVLKACKEHKVKNFIFASSSSVYGDRSDVPFKEDDCICSPASPYASTKVVGEMLCRFYSQLVKSTQFTCLRFFTVYGENGRKDMAPYIFMTSIHHKLPFKVFGNGTQMRDFTYVGDIVDGIVLAMTKVEEENFNIYNLGNSSPIMLNDFIKKIEKVVGKKATYKNIGKQKGDVFVTYASIEKAKQQLNYSPKVDLDEGLTRMYRWLKKQ